MPRGVSKPFPIVSSILDGNRAADIQAGCLRAEEASEVLRQSIEQSVSGFVDAWFKGDASAMLSCLHPDYVHRLMSIEGRSEPPGEASPEPPEALVRDAVGVQGHFGSMTAPERRRRDVRILDVRHHSASAVAVMRDWILQVHLARWRGQWCIVNTMWEMT